MTVHSRQSTLWGYVFRSPAAKKDVVSLCSKRKLNVHMSPSQLFKSWKLSHTISLNAWPEDAGPESRFRGTQKIWKTSKPDSPEGKNMPMSPQLSRDHFHSEEFPKKINLGKVTFQGWDDRADFFARAWIVKLQVKEWNLRLQRINFNPPNDIL